MCVKEDEEEEKKSIISDLIVFLSFFVHRLFVSVSVHLARLQEQIISTSNHHIIFDRYVLLFFFPFTSAYSLSLFADILLTRWLTWWSFFSFLLLCFLFLLFHHHRFCTLSLFDYINIVKIVVSSLFYSTRFPITMVLVGYHFDVYLFISFRIKKKERQRIKETAADGNLVDWWSDRTLTSKDARWDNVKETLDVSVVVDGPSSSLSFPFFFLFFFLTKNVHIHTHTSSAFLPPLFFFFFFSFIVLFDG